MVRLIHKSNNETSKKNVAYYTCSIHTFNNFIRTGEVLNAVEYMGIKQLGSYSKSLSKTHNIDWTSYEFSNSPVLMQYKFDLNKLNQEFLKDNCIYDGSLSSLKSSIIDLTIILNHKWLNDKMQALNSAYSDWAECLESLIPAQRVISNRKYKVRLLREVYGKGLSYSYFSTCYDLNGVLTLIRRWTSFIKIFIPILNNLNGKIKEFSSNVRFFNKEKESDHNILARSIIEWFLNKIHSLPFPLIVLYDMKSDNMWEFRDYTKQDLDDNLYKLLLLLMRNDKNMKIIDVYIYGLEMVIKCENEEHSFTFYPSNIL